MADAPTQRILVVDEELEYGKTVQKIVQNMGHHCAFAEDAFEALERLADEQFDLVISDLVMLGKDGLELAREARAKYPYLDFIVMSGHATVQPFISIINAGAVDLIGKPFSREELGAKIDRIARERRMIQDLKERNEELRRAYDEIQSILEQTVHALTSTLEMRDPYTAGHQKRVSALAHAIAREMCLPEDVITGVRLAGLVHDIGKISIPIEVLSKPSELDAAEMRLIKQHSQVGCEILEKVKFPWPIAQTVLQHHERLDGSGYPEGLLAEDILPEARILAVADVVEAMNSDRSYRSAHSVDEAFEEIIPDRGTLYDPEVVDACVRLFTEKGYEQIFSLLSARSDSSGSRTHA